MLRLILLGVVLCSALISMNRQNSAGRLPEPREQIAETAAQTLNSATHDSDHQATEPGFPFHFTPQAFEHILPTFQQHHSQDKCVRFWLTPGGCSGYTFNLTITDRPEAGDLVYSKDGMRLAIPGQQQKALHGASFDYVVTPTEAGLSIVLSKEAFATTEPREDNLTFPILEEALGRKTSDEQLPAKQPSAMRSSAGAMSLGAQSAKDLRIGEK